MAIFESSRVKKKPKEVLLKFGLSNPSLSLAFFKWYTLSVFGFKIRDCISIDYYVESLHAFSMVSINEQGIR